MFNVSAQPFVIKQRNANNQQWVPKRTTYSQSTLKHDIKWYFRMNPKGKDTGLIGFYGKQTLIQEGIILACDTVGKNKVYKQFAYFKTIDDAIDHIMKFDLKDRHFYEVIGATTPQLKPYFDIDINTRSPIFTQENGDSLATKALFIITDTIVRVLKEKYNVQISKGDVSIYETKYIRNVCVPNKQGSLTCIPEKYSFHVVIQGVYFSNYTKMKLFGRYIKQLLGGVDCIDDIWSSTRQFRMLGSMKGDKDSAKETFHRFLMTKEFLNDHPYFDNSIPVSPDSNEYRDVIKKSLVTNIDECKLLE